MPFGKFHREWVFEPSFYGWKGLGKENYKMGSLKREPEAEKKAEQKHGSITVPEWFPMRKHFFGSWVSSRWMEKRSQELVGDKPIKVSKARSRWILKLD
jgi:hypothetical protein